MKGIWKVVLVITLIYVSSVFPQDPQPKHITWTNEKECLTVNLPQDEKPECDMVVDDGIYISIIRYRGITFAGSHIDDGDYFIFDLIVRNDSSERILADPNDSRMFLWKSTDPTTEPEILSRIEPTAIAKKLKRRVAWANIFGGLSTVSKTKTATVNTTTNTGVTAESTISTPDTDAQNAEAQKAKQRSESANAAGANVVGSAFKANTLFEKQAESGLIYFKRKKKTKIGKFVVKVDGVFYNFRFSRL